MDIIVYFIRIIFILNSYMPNINTIIDKKEMDNEIKDLLK